MVLIIALAAVIGCTTHRDVAANGLYPGVTVYRNSLMASYDAVLIPPFGIFVSNNGQPHLIDHEYGHFLQYRSLGLFRFYRDIALRSLYNSYENKVEKLKFGHVRYSVVHDFYITETSANTLADQYFKKPPNPFYPGYEKTRTPTYNCWARTLIYLTF